MSDKLLSKSKFKTGLSCPLQLWVAVNSTDELPELDRDALFRIEQGNIVGQLAKKLFPKGIDIAEADFKKNLKESKKLIKTRKILFEVAITADDLYARADVLKPVGRGSWDIIEVKGTSKVKDDHIIDVSFQKYVYEKAGLNIRKCFLLHLNKDFSKKGKVNPKKLFVMEDISSKVSTEGISEKVSELRKLLSKSRPKLPISSCEDAEKCPVHAPTYAKHTVFHLYRAKKKCMELYDEGVHSILDIPEDIKLNVKQSIQKECANTKKPHINKKGIKDFLDSVKYPLYYLDFETFSEAVPRFDKSRPWQQIPFQFSLHEVDKKGNVKHSAFLYDKDDDPRLAFAESLKKVWGKKGSIIVFNQTFEINRFKELARDFPKYKKWVNSVLKRIVDLLAPFRNFDYYNPVQNGSASIKKVLPAVTGKSYSGLEINNGADASLSFMDMMYNKKGNSKTIRANLEKYCKLDTEGMIWILDKLRIFVEK